MTLQKYSKMKDSGIEWIGEIPESWNVFPSKHIIQLKHGHQFRSKDYVDTGIPVVRITQITPDGEIDLQKSLFVPENWIHKYSDFLLSKGDILMALTGATIGKTGRIISDIGKAFQNYRVGNFIPKNNKISREYIYYLLSSDYAYDQILINVNQASQPNIGQDYFDEIKFPIPLITEQKQITTYLDNKTDRINLEISKNKKLIELLKEQRQSVINHAVTKGLDDTVPMKDSGIEWIGKIPVTYTLEPLKYHVKINEKTLGKKTEPNLDIYYIDVGSVHSNGMVDDPEKMSFDDSPSRARRIIHENDTIVSTVRTYLKAITFIDKSKDGCICSTGFAVLSPSESLNSKFLYWVISSPSYVDTIMANSVGVSYPAINSTELGQFPFIFPSNKKEQKQISDYLDEKTMKTDSLIFKVESQIQKLKDFKKSLISLSVTGKICVTN